MKATEARQITNGNPIEPRKEFIFKQIQNAAKDGLSECPIHNMTESEEAILFELGYALIYNKYADKKTKTIKW